MIKTTDLLSIAKERLLDAESLYNAERYDGAVYLCGYSIEIALKYKICITLNWQGFPSSNNEFSNFKSLRTHDLEVLLSFSGIEAQIKSNNFADWSNIAVWNPEARYNLSGKVSKTDTFLMIRSAKNIISFL